MREIDIAADFDNLCQSTVLLDKILVVDFFAVWCGPCTKASPIFEKLSNSYHYTDVYFVKVNVDTCAELAHRERINSLPTFKIYTKGSCAETITGNNMSKLEKAINDIYLDESIKEMLTVPPSQLFQQAKAKLLSVANIAASKIALGGSFEINLSDPVFEKYFLVVPACMQFLFSMGFQELTESLILPANSDRRLINKLIRQLKGPPPPRITPANNAFLSKLETYRHEISLFANPAYQEMAQKLVPLETLLEEAAELGGTPATDVKPSVLLRALLRWFKEDFFNWVQDRVCDNCGSIMSHHSGQPTEVESQEGLARVVEVYTCPVSSAHPQKRFPRFNNPTKLLQTREGRCGEWGACFSFILASLRTSAGSPKGEPWFPGVRLVFDITDHVFCEVWLTDLKDLDQATPGSEGRWVHVDPCEGLIDVPLVYEQGWKKKLSYMFAFTVPPPLKDSLRRYEAVDVTDVVWKYSTDFKGVCLRRKSISESYLARYLAQVHDEAAQAFPEDETVPFGLCTTVQELAVMLLPPRPSLESFQGRKSGALSWRLSRLELGVTPSTWEGLGFTIFPTSSELAQGCVYIRYSCSLDSYARPYHREVPAADSEDSDVSSGRSSRGPKHFREIYQAGWKSMALRWRNVARKVEKDWKMVYLARREGSRSYDDGVIEWLIDLSDTNHCVKAVTLFATMAIFEERSKVTLELTTDMGKSRSLTLGSSPLSACADFAGAKQLRLIAHLWNALENDDPSVWQKAQIFRQKENDHDIWPLELKVMLQRDDGADVGEKKD